jgi:hypothetical protein
MRNKLSMVSLNVRIDKRLQDLAQVLSVAVGVCSVLDNLISKSGRRCRARPVQRTSKSLGSAPNCADSRQTVALPTTALT